MIWTVSGIIAPVTGAQTPSGATWGLDGGNYFGGGSLAGQSYSVTWTANDCECIGTPNFGPLANHYPNANPISDVSITINGHTYDFGGQGWYGEFYLNGPNIIQQTGYLDGGSFISTSVGFAQTPGVLGEFEIINNANYTTQMTSGIFMAPTQTFNSLAAVPGPILGAGWPALVFIGLFLWNRRRAQA
jgi:hypothetical protein